VLPCIFSQLEIAQANFLVERFTKPFWSLFDPEPCSFSLLALKCARHTVERQVCSCYELKMFIQTPCECNNLRVFACNAILCGIN
jgi:hypothetical protein